jgi:hypothetical protein
MDQEKKLFKLYHDMCEQKLIVYTGTSQAEIKDTIYEILDIPTTEKIQVLDEEGNPIVLSSNLPNEIQLYIQIKKSYTDKLFSSELPQQEAGSIEWFWNTPSNKSHMLKNNNKTVYQPSNETQSWCLGDLVMEKGEFYYTLLFEPLQCCVQVCVYPIGQVLKEVMEDYNDFWRLWTEYKSPNEHPGPVVEAGFYINMDTKEYAIYDHKEKTLLKKCEIKWSKVCPAVYFKHVVSVTITSNALMGKPEWMKD